MADLRPHAEPHPDVAGFVLGTLEPDEAAQFTAHLANCPACRQELEELSPLPDLLAGLPPAVEAPPELEAQTFGRIAAAESTNDAGLPTPGASAPPMPVGAAPAGTGARNRPGATAPSTPVGELPAPQTRPTARRRIVPLEAYRRRRAGQLLLAAAAAIVVFVAGIGVATTLRHSQQASVATIRLISADGGPAHGAATIRATQAGLTIDMSVTALAPSRAGTMYTCWLVADDDTLNHPDRVSVGSFLVRAPNTTVTVHWTTAADLAHFSHLGITEEPTNGNPAHRGPKVLVAG